MTEEQAHRLEANRGRPSLLTLAEMAERFDLHPRTFSKLVKSKRIPHLAVGRKRLFNPERVEAYLETQDAEAKPLRSKPAKIAEYGEFGAALGLVVKSAGAKARV